MSQRGCWRKVFNMIFVYSEDMADISLQYGEACFKAPIVKYIHMNIIPFRNLLLYRIYWLKIAKPDGNESLYLIGKTSSHVFI